MYIEIRTTINMSLWNSRFNETLQETNLTPTWKMVLYIAGAELSSWELNEVFKLGLKPGGRGKCIKLISFFFVIKRITLARELVCCVPEDPSSQRLATTPYDTANIDRLNHSYMCKIPQSLMTTRNQVLRQRLKLLQTLKKALHVGAVERSILISGGSRIWGYGGPTFLGIRIAHPPPPLRGFPEATIKVYAWMF